MGFLDNLRDRLRGDEPVDDYYDDYDERFDDGYGAYDEPRATSGVLGNTSRPEAESVSVYTRSGRPVEEGVRSPSAGGFSTSQRFGDESWGTQETHRRAGEGAPSATSVLGNSRTPTPGDIGLTPMPRMSSGKLPPYVLKPTSYDDVQMVIRRVRTQQPVVISFKNTQIETAKRILDFCFGLTCGIDGAVEEVADRVFVVLPKGIELSEADIEKLKREGVIGG
ncbi:cell division protein SepF [Olsenella sp. YH-ols2217]|uniref:Cell division protein SepF n=1 Tax=Kribbibacterium absianum TaxID=3044210 RepID=A0ABT6ZM27_9ACTN|nr:MULTISPECIES: cell division protein SepF [unclassified Olsenella]MDJ1122082.1 cell division protein SepF [Olsenella sp. YH-ols2216]MDJ1130090.1 cell division protein SepF [Olsenella sp. YH-ols2217]